MVKFDGKLHRISQLKERDSLNRDTMRFSTQKIRICQAEIEELIDEKVFYSGGIIQDDHILVLSRTQDPRVSIVAFAGHIKKTFEGYEKNNVELGVCSDILLTFPQRSIFIRKLNDISNSKTPDVNQFWIVISINPSKRNFKEKVNQLSRNICETLFIT